MTLKKTLLIGLVGALALPALAQKIELTSAIIERTKRRDINKAKEYIDKAYNKIESGSTLKAKDLGKFWHNRGLIYMDLYTADSNMANLEVAFDAFQKDMEIPESAYSKKSRARLPYIADKFLRIAYKHSDNKEYKESLAPFAKMFETKALLGITDTININYAAIMALNGEDYTTSIMYTDQLIAMEPTNEQYHINRLAAYDRMEDKDGYIAALEKSKAECVGCKNIILEEVNYYIGTGETDKLLASLNNAIEATPDNHILYFAKGATIASTDKPAAKTAYLKAIELNPEFSDTYVNLAAIYMEEANEIADKMSNLGFSKADQAKHDAFKKERKGIFTEAKPYMEKAVELDEKNTSILNALMNVYYELGETDKWKETKAKYDALK